MKGSQMNSRHKSYAWLPALGVTLMFCLSAVQQSILRVEPAQLIRSLRLEDAEDDDPGEGVHRPDQPDAAARFRRLQMQDEKGSIPVDGLEKARLHVASMKKAQQEGISKVVAPQAAGIKPDSLTQMRPGNI